jgi:DNA repair protein RecO (recombination protein O)
MEKSRGTLIRLTKLTDSSWIVHWFTREHGLIKTVARGARASRSSFAGKLDLFYEAEFIWYPTRSGELHRLGEVDVLDTREPLRRDYQAMLLAAYCCCLVETAVERGHPEPEMQDLLFRALNHVTEKGASMKALQHFEHQMAEQLGFAHEDRKRSHMVLREGLGALPPQRVKLVELIGEKPATGDSS